MFSELRVHVGTAAGPFIPAQPVRPAALRQSRVDLVHTGTPGVRSQCASWFPVGVGNCLSEGLPGDRSGRGQAGGGVDKEGEYLGVLGARACRTDTADRLLRVLVSKFKGLRGPLQVVGPFPSPSLPRLHHRGALLHVWALVAPGFFEHASRNLECSG